MKYLFTLTGSRILESLCFTDTLYAFDFDGTLAPIVDTPSDAKMPATINSLIKNLADHKPVAIISGRSISDLKERLSFTPHYLIGNHGLEGLSLRDDSARQAHSICQNWKSQLAKTWKKDRIGSGVIVEDKNYSLALHYRQSRQKKETRLALFESIHQLDPSPRVVLGKCVMNLIPAGAPHKGVAVLELMMKLNLKCAFYVGDDDTDEDVFSLPDPRVITVRVGQRKTSQAQYFVKRQTEMPRLLREILKQVEKCR